MREKHIYGKDLKIHHGCECLKKEYKGYVENQKFKKKKRIRGKLLFSMYIEGALLGYGTDRWKASATRAASLSLAGP